MSSMRGHLNSRQAAAGSSLDRRAGLDGDDGSWSFVQRSLEVEEGISYSSRGVRTPTSPSLVLPSKLGPEARFGEEENNFIGAAPVSLASPDLRLTGHMPHSAALDGLQLRAQRRRFGDNSRAMSEVGEQLACTCEL